MTNQLSVSEFRQLNMTQIMLGPKEIRDSFVSKDTVRDALTHNRTVLDSYNSDTSSLNQYNVVDEFNRYACIEVYTEGEHQTQKLFQLELNRGRVDGESYNVAMIDFVVNGEVDERLFIR